MTQELRNVAEKVRWGFASADDLHAAISSLENTLGLPFTEAESLS